MYRNVDLFFLFGLKSQFKMARLHTEWKFPFSEMQVVAVKIGAAVPPVPCSHLSLHVFPHVVIVIPLYPPQSRHVFAYIFSERIPWFSIRCVLYESIFVEHELGIGIVPPLFSCRLVPITCTMELGTHAAANFSELDPN